MYGYNYEVKPEYYSITKFRLKFVNPVLSACHRESNQRARGIWGLEYRFEAES